MFRQRLMLIFIFMMLSMVARAQSTISRDRLIADTRQFAHVLETVHPDPYINGGGKVAFHRRLHQLLAAIPEDGMTVDDFCILMRPFIVALQDSHTFFNEPYGNYDPYAPGGIPLYFDVVEKSLFVFAVSHHEHKELIGCRLVAVEDIPFREIVERQKNFYGARNEYAFLMRLAKRNTLWKERPLSLLIPEWKDHTKIEVTLEHPTGEIKDYLFDLSKGIKYPLSGTGSRFTLPQFGKHDFGYEFLDDEKKTAMLIVDDLSTYREVFERWHYRGLSHLYKSKSRRLYKDLFGTEPPEDDLEVIAAIPSATETIRSLVEEMKEAGTRLLLVDLRRNSGGSSVFSNILLYFLYGEQAMVSAGASFSEVKRYSPFYFDTHPKEKISDLDSVIPLVETDYVFVEDYYGWEPGNQSAMKRAQSRLDREKPLMPTFGKLYDTGEYDGYYRPDHVVVLCSGDTFSSAYTMMVYLYRAGATVVGRPSAQDGHGFGDILPFNLDNTRLKGFVSHKYFDTFAEDPKNRNALIPHHELTYEKLASFEFDQNAAVLYALELFAVDPRTLTKYWSSDFR